MIYLIDGFDMQSNYTDILLGFRDYSNYWSQPSVFGALTFVEGNGGGGAARKQTDRSFPLSNTNGTVTNRVPDTARSLRMYASKRQTLSATTFYAIMTFRWTNSSTIQVLCDGAGQMRIAEWLAETPGTPNIDPGELRTGTFTPLVTESTWLDLEFSVSSSGLAELYVDGTLVLSAQCRAPDGPLFGYTLNNINPNFQSTQWFDWDHVVITDGERLTTEGHRAYAVTAAWDRWEHINAGLYGVIIYDGLAYRTDANLTTRPPSVPGEDRAYTTYFLFEEDPRTSAAFTSPPDSWGVCTEFLSGDGRRIKLSALTLSIVTVEEGRVRIRTQGPSLMTYRSGPWVKSDPAVPAATHLSDLPRDFEEGNLIYTMTENGCIAFPYVADPDAPPSFAELGISFAEEFRTDYNDWYRVTGIPLPFSSYFVTGYSVLAEGNKKFQSNYVTVHYEPLSEGSAYMQGVWDYSLSGDTGRWSSRQQVYSNNDMRYANRMRKLKVRGHGKALQMRIESEDNKPFTVNGWSTMASSNAGV